MFNIIAYIKTVDKLLLQIQRNFKRRFIYKYDESFKCKFLFYFFCKSLTNLILKGSRKNFFAQVVDQMKKSKSSLASEPILIKYNRSMQPEKTIDN